MIQPSLWEDEKGSVHALMRTQNGYIYRADSNDGGKSFCAAYKTKIYNNNSGIDCAKTEDGTVALICNPIPPHCGRTPLSLLLSRDGGANFEKILDLEKEKGEFSYPAVVTRGNTLYITYTYDRKEIAYAEIEL